MNDKSKNKTSFFQLKQTSHNGANYTKTNDIHTQHKELSRDTSSASSPSFFSPRPNSLR